MGSELPADPMPPETGWTRPMLVVRNQHDTGITAAGLNAYTGDVIDTEHEGVITPLRVKTQAIESATEAAVMLLRIDDVVVAGELKGGQVDTADDDAGGPPAGGPGGGMGGAM